MLGATLCAKPGFCSKLGRGAWGWWLLGDGAGPDGRVGVLRSWRGLRRTRRQAARPTRRRLGPPGAARWGGGGCSADAEEFRDDVLASIWEVENHGVARVLQLPGATNVDDMQGSACELPGSHGPRLCPETLALLMRHGTIKATVTAARTPKTDA